MLHLRQEIGKFIERVLLEKMKFTRTVINSIEDYYN